MSDLIYLKKTLKLAEKRQGFCAPNPSVGAVVVKNDQVIATGNHFSAGHPHAEIVALEKANTEAKGAILYCTLEPCCHWGKTPPCVDAIIQAGIKKVVYGYKDPDARVNGQGEKILKQAGVECVYCPTPEINAFYQSYSRWKILGLPYVTAKLAISLDSKIAYENGVRAMISGEKAAEFTHQNRLKSDAILTTAKTILADNPQLNVRLKNRIIKKPVYIIDRQNKLSRKEKIFETAERVHIFNESHFSLSDMLKIIGQNGHYQLWVEAGGELFSALIRENLLQKALVYISPKTLGSRGIPAFSGETDLFKHVKITKWSSKGEDTIGEFYWG